MIVTRHMRRKRARRRQAARARAKDEIDDPSFPEYVWLPLVGIGLVLLAIGSLAGAASVWLGDVFRALYALACLVLFALTSLYLGGAAAKSIRESALNARFHRQQPLRQVISQAFQIVSLGALAYAPSVLIPALVFQAAWLTDLMLLLLGLILAYSLYTLVRWASTRREAGQR
jgi:hypothetical protein